MRDVKWETQLKRLLHRTGMDRWRDRVESISQESAEERQQKLAKDSLKFCDRYSSEVSSLHHYCVKLSVLRYSSEVSSLH